jgi:hypothetical protein
MVTGDLISVAQKKKKSIQKDWVVPLIIAGNRFPEYNDRNGCIVRRFPLFPFRNLVTSRDTTLQDRIVAIELPQIILRCIRRYHEFRLQVGSQDFWKFVPPIITEGREEIRNNTDELSNFLSNGSSYYQIAKRPGRSTMLKELASAFSNYMQFERKKRGVVMGSDLYPIKAAGFKIKVSNACKVCGSEKVNRATCGEHYDRQNRRRLTFVVDMEIIVLKNQSHSRFNDDVQWQPDSAKDSSSTVSWNDSIFD